MCMHSDPFQPWPDIELNLLKILDGILTRNDTDFHNVASDYKNTSLEIQGCQESDYKIVLAEAQWLSRFPDGVIIIGNSALI